MVFMNNLRFYKRFIKFCIMCRLTLFFLLLFLILKAGTKEGRSGPFGVQELAAKGMLLLLCFPWIFFLSVFSFSLFLKIKFLELYIEFPGIQDIVSLPQVPLS